MDELEQDLLWYEKRVQELEKLLASSRANEVYLASQLAALQAEFNRRSRDEYDYLPYHEDER